MNDDTFNIISGLTPKVKKMHSHNKTAAAILLLDEHQAENNNNIIQQCQAEIEKLKEQA